MGGPYRYKIRFSGIVVEFILPTPIQPPVNMELLRCDSSVPAQDTYTLRLLERPLRPRKLMVSSHGEARIFHTSKGWLHIYPALGDGNGCQVACLFCPNGKHTIYYPASRWEEYSEVWRFAHLICGERLLLRHNAFLLHSSLVRLHGKAVLFCGASGAGKSTQASLWQEHLGAEILNGDRTVIQRRKDGFWGSGSPWSGTSGIYSPEEAPIAGIFLVEKAPENRVEKLGFPAFSTLLSQTIVNSWDPEFMDAVTGLIADVMDTVPIYRLYCRPCKEAVLLVHDTLFGKENAP